jgi:hypothetical protein
MAYLRKEKEIVEMDYPLSTVWVAIQKAIPDIDWIIEETNEAEHKVKAKTTAGFMSYSSLLSIEAVVVAENVTRVDVSAETPTTTLTAIADFGKTRERIDLFLVALIKQLKPSKKDTAKERKD